MNSLTQTDLQTYLRRLVKEHLPAKGTASKRRSQQSATPHKRTDRSNPGAQSKGENR